MPTSSSRSATPWSKNVVKAPETLSVSNASVMVVDDPNWSATPDGRNYRSRSYAANMASQWKTLQRLAENLVDLTASEVPKLIRQLQHSPTVQRGIQIGLDAIIGATSEAPAEITTGRPVTRASVPSAHRARRLVYSPNLDGRADPGEIVWTWVTYEEDPTHGKDRPVLVVGRDRATLLGLMMSSQERHAADRSWVRIGSGSWDDDGRPSWVRLDRVLDVPEEGIRREGAILDRTLFDIVADRLRRDYAWS
jgi:hypothetical protein